MGRWGSTVPRTWVSPPPTVEERITQITNGKGLMTAFDGILTEDEIKAVAQYTMQFKTEAE